MKQIVYTFQNRGCYLPDQPAKFDREEALRLIVEPHTFELNLSGEVLRSSSCEGFVIDVTDTGAVRIFDGENRLLASAEGTARKFRQVELVWKQDLLQLNFGSVQTVDYYPNCDGEHDRWGTEWVTEYEVRFDITSSQISARPSEQ